MKIFGIVGWKNSGKTGLVERLVAEITGRGFRVSTIKHAHHTFDVDYPGKDSYRHRQAGAHEVLLSSRRRWALMHENRESAEAGFDELLAKIAPVDLVLVEGFKTGAQEKIEAHRAENGKELLAASDPLIRAVAADAPLADVTVPVFDLDDTGAIADFILAKTGLVASEPDAGPGELPSDCFSLPAGVDWLPVDAALANLKAGMRPVVATSTMAIDGALGRVLAQDVVALRSNPPAANSAVDGYAVSSTWLGPDGATVPLVAGRAAAGAPFSGPVPDGHTVRILTGALLPDGTDCVAMQEDVTVRDGRVIFGGGLAVGANVRQAGEDAGKGATVLSKGRVLAPQDLALMSAVGVAEVHVREPLRIGVLSTGDELAAPGADAPPHQTYDANRPMLLAIARKWGLRPVDLGNVGDDRDLLAKRLDRGAAESDVILTSGGASAGDEDHLAALLEEAGSLNHWRIAIKPGRPLALGHWRGVPVFGLPGNPVAAFVCALVFARPAIRVLAGADWQEPVGFDVPAAFEKRKKPGRREYLRARLNERGEVAVFASEGSGRVSGLSWADGLVELADGARHIRPGDPVRYIPFASFDL